MWPWLSWPAPLIPSIHLLPCRPCTLSDTPCCHCHQTPETPVYGCLSTAWPSNHPPGPSPLRSTNLCPSRCLRLRLSLRCCVVTLHGAQAREGALGPPRGGSGMALAWVATWLERSDFEEDVARTGSHLGMDERPGAEGSANLPWGASWTPWCAERGTDRVTVLGEHNQRVGPGHNQTSARQWDWAISWRSSQSVTISHDA